MIFCNNLNINHNYFLQFLHFFLQNLVHFVIFLWDSRRPNIAMHCSNGKGDSAKKIKGPNCHRNWSPSWNSLSWGVSISYVHEGVFVVTRNNSLALNVFDVGTWDQGRSGGFLPDRDFKGGKLILSDPCGCLKGPRVGLNDPLWCILSMWNVLWSFWASQGSIWGTRQFHPVEPSI